MLNVERLQEEAEIEMIRCRPNVAKDVSPKRKKGPILRWFLSHVDLSVFMKFSIKEGTSYFKTDRSIRIPCRNGIGY